VSSVSLPNVQSITVFVHELGDEQLVGGEIALAR
jgi:hypothetical protein